VDREICGCTISLAILFANFKCLAAFKFQTRSIEGKTHVLRNKQVLIKPAIEEYRLCYWKFLIMVKLCKVALNLKKRTFLHDSFLLSVMSGDYLPPIQKKGLGYF